MRRLAVASTARDMECRGSAQNRCRLGASPLRPTQQSGRNRRKPRRAQRSLEAYPGSMKSYRLTQAAEGDLFEIWTFIAADNVLEADRLEEDLLNACQRAANRPDVGHFRRDLTDKPVRFLLVRSTYLIVYDPATEP